MTGVFFIAFLAGIAWNTSQAGEVQKEFDWDKARWRCPSSVKLGSAEYPLVFGKVTENGVYNKPMFLGRKEKNGKYVEDGAQYYAFDPSSGVVHLECRYDGFPDEMTLYADAAYCVVEVNKSVRAACWAR